MIPIKKSTLLLTVVGLISTASAYGLRPSIPKWVLDDTYGFGYVFRTYPDNEVQAQFDIEQYFETSWDFDYNCMRLAWQNHLDGNWGEYQMCNGLYQEYQSQTGQCTVIDINGLSLKDHYEEWIDEFELLVSDQIVDPVWHEGNYAVFKHQSTKTFIYTDPEEGIIQFILYNVENEDYDRVVYFPESLKWDQSIEEVYDFEMEYGYCAPPKPIFSTMSMKSSKPQINFFDRLVSIK